MRWNARLGWRTLLAVMVVALTWELACRVDDWVSYQAPVQSRYGMNILYRDSPWGPIGNPGARFGKWRINSEGFRGPEVPAWPDATTVVTYGASETFGMYESEGNEFPRRLENMLNASGGSRFRVLNMALPGMRVGSGAAYLSQVVSRYHASIVVMYPTPAHYIGVSRDYCDREVRPLPEDWNKGALLRLPERLSDLIKGSLPRAVMTRLRHWSIALSQRGKPTLEVVDEASYRAWEDDLRCAIRAARSAGAGIPVLVTHANRFGLKPAKDDMYWLVAWRQQYSELDEHAFIAHERRSNEILRQVARDEGVLLVDAAAAMNGKAGYFQDYAHFTNEGAQAMARLIHSALIERSNPTARHER